MGNDLASLKSYYNKIDKKNNNLLFDIKKINLDNFEGSDLNSQIERKKFNMTNDENDIFSNSKRIKSDKEKEIDFNYINNDFTQKNYKHLDNHNSDNISSISELKNNFKFGNLDEENLSKQNGVYNFRNPYTNKNNTLSSERVVNENSTNFENDNFSVNKLFEKNQMRLKNLNQYDNQGN